MANDSTTAGFLQPTSTLVGLYDDALENVIQAWLVGMTGLDASLVRPAANVEPGNLPDISVNWCAFWIGEHQQDTFAAEVKPDALTTRVQRSETFTVRCSFYGPLCAGNAALVNDGIQVSQNRDALLAHDIAILGARPIVRVPELVKNQWYKRADLPLDMKRGVIREYSVLSILSADGTLDNEHYITQIEVNQ